jgi:DNA-binding NarL/FixJ family response regulator
VYNIRVISVDDNRLVHEAVQTVVSTQRDIELVARAYSGEEAIRLADTHCPDVILMDVVMPGMGGPAATRIIQERHPSIQILVLSGYQDDENVHQMLQNGASAYILKHALLADLVNTVRAVLSGNTVLSAPITMKLLEGYSAHRSSADFRLTSREIEVVRLMAEGLSLTEMARQLVISPSTVKFHISNILQKMNVTTRAEAIVLAAKSNLV